MCSIVFSMTVFLSVYLQIIPDLRQKSFLCLCVGMNAVMI